MEKPGSKREAILIVNAQSRSGQDDFEKAKAALIEAGVALVQSHSITEPDKMSQTVRDAVASGVAMVIIGGGDGSLSENVDHFVGSNCIFAILPLGTANSSARTLGIPLDIKGAVDIIAHGKVRRIDLGMIDGDYFVNASSLGLGPLVGESVPSGLKRYLGRLGYLIWAAKCNLTFKPFHVILSGDGVYWEGMSTEVRILNGSYHGGVELSDHAKIDSGKINVQIVTGKGRMRLFKDWLAKGLKLKVRNETSCEFSGESFRLETRPNLPVSIDGEVYKRTPVMVSVAKRAINVMEKRP